MPNLRARADEVIEVFADHARAVSRSTAFVRIALVLGGTAIIALAQCVTLPATGTWPIWSVIGLIGTALAFVGGVAIVFWEPSAAKALALAQRTLEDAREAETEADSVYFYIAELKRATELYGAAMLMRRAVEGLLAKSTTDPEAIAKALLGVADRPLKLALDFQAADHWTVGIYRIDGAAGSRVLRCCAQLRSVECDLKDARLWPEGKGAGWIALANDNDVVVPDVKSPAMGTIFEGMLKPEDFGPFKVSRCRSHRPLGRRRKMGAVVATSDQEGHFSLDPRPGVRPLEAARALAGMMALALTDHRQRSPKSA